MESDNKIEYLIRHAECRGSKEKKLLTINHEHGEIVLELYNYFDVVATVKKVKLICKTIGFESDDWNRLFLELTTFLENEIVFFKNYKKVKANDYRESHQKVADTQRIVDSGKYPVGVYLTKSELKDAKHSLKTFKDSERYDKREFKNAERQNKRYSKFLSTVNAFIDKYNFRSDLTSNEKEIKR